MVFAVLDGVENDAAAGARVGHLCGEGGRNTRIGECSLGRAGERGAF